MLLVALVGGFAFVVPGVALASTGHAFEGAFTPRDFGGAAHDADSPGGIGVLGSSGDVFTADPNGSVQRFDGSGGFVASFEVPGATYDFMTGLAVDSSGAGAVYVVMRHNGAVSDSDLLKFGADGVFTYELDQGPVTVGNNTATTAMAVDPVDGSLYASAFENGSPVVAHFDGSTGAFLGSINGSTSQEGAFWCPPSSPSSLAVDGAQQVYVLDLCKGPTGQGRVDRYDASGAFVATVDDGSRGAPKAVAADPVSGEVYVAQAATGLFGLAEPHVTRFEAGGGAAVSSFGLGVTFGLDGFFPSQSGASGMAVNGAGTVYLADGTFNRVARFGRFDGPTVVTGSATVDSPREATLEGTIDPEGEASTYHFEYGIENPDGTGSYDTRTEESAEVTGSDPVAVTPAALTGLKPNKTYHYRLVASNSSGSISDIPVPGPDQKFTTAEAPASVVGPEFATAIGPRSARVHGTANANSRAGSAGSGGYGADYSVEYGTTTAYGQSTSNFLCFLAACETGDDLPMAVSLSGLLPGTTYHFRFVVDNGFGGPQFSGDQTFTTAPAAGGGATGVTTKRATLTGTIDPHGEETTYRFNYGRTSAYGTSTEEVDAGAGDGEQQVSLPVSGLSPDTTYHVQVVATSDNGVTRYGADGLFKTAPAPTAVAMISPVSVSTGSATLTGEVDTHGRPGSYRFDVSSLDSSYSFSTVERAVAGSDGVEEVSVPVDGLPAGETFVVRLRVTSNDSTRLSDLITFKTASVPRVFPPSPTRGGARSFGCAAPRLDSYDSKPKPGDTIKVSGRDLGAGGTAILDDRSVVPADWTAGGFELEIPEGADGTLGLTVNCGKRSNTIAIAIYKRPSSRFSIANTTVNGLKATLSIRVPGPGKLTSSAAKAKPGKVTIKKARGAKLVVRLNRAGIRALRRSKTGRLKVAVRVRYLPAGGRAATKTVTVTFNRTGGR